MFITYNASAGSGKTTNLVAEFLSICLENPTQYKHILAITFTNNATAEMKKRIVETLNRFAFCDYDQLGSSEKAIFEMVQKKLSKFSNYHDIQEPSKRLLSNILYDYPNFSVSTIDSFFIRLIRAFSLSGNFNFSVEVTLDDYFSQTIDILMNRISKNDKDLSKRMLDLIDNQLEETGRWQIEKELTKMLYKIYEEDTYLPMQELAGVTDFQSVVKKMIGKKKNLLSRFIELADIGQALIDATRLEAADFIQGNRGVYTWFSRTSTEPTKMVSDSYVVNCIEKGSFTKTVTLPPQQHNGIVAAYHEMKEIQRQLLLIDAFTKNLQAISFLLDLKGIMDEIKYHDNLFYLSEANFKINNEIKDKEDTPYIYERIGNKYENFFIDEFQDTCKLQWDNLLPLVLNALASGGKSILFGDVKQAIYRFRNGDSTLFSKLTTKEGYQNEIAPMDKECELFEMVPLLVNYRTDGNVVDFNNRFFTYWRKLKEDDAMTQNYYKDVSQNICPGKEHKGFVSIQFKGDTEEDYVLTEVLKAVEDALARGFQLKDIAILAKGKQTCSDLGNFLTSKKHEVISSDSLLLASSDEVNLIVSVLRFLVDADDQLSQVVIANYVIKNSNMSRYSLHDAIEMINHGQLLTFLSDFGVNLNPSELLKLPLFTLVKHIIALFELNAPNAFVSALVETVLSYLENHNGELVTFLDWWENQKGSISISTPSGKNAITIMTIHKSKGLQFPVVIMPFMQYPHKKTKQEFWYKDEDGISGLPYVLLKNNKSLNNIGLENYFEEESNKTAIDNLNILYVAHTRPQNALYIITGMNKNHQEGKKNSGNYNLFLSDFIEANKNDFVEDEKDSLHFWFGDKDYRFTPKEKSTDNQPAAISKIYYTDFAQTNLAYGSLYTKTDEQGRGIAVHDYLSHLKHFPQSNQEIDELTFTNETYAFDIRDALRNILKHQKFGDYFAENVKVLNEISILSSSGEVKRPDRVILKDDEVVVIDYKTGDPSAIYEQQISEYVSLIQQMGYHNVSGLLLYI